MPTYNKLVRDNIPAIITQSGKTPVVRTLSESEYKDELKKKLLEEVQEFINAESEADMVEEFADIQTVLNYIEKAFGINAIDVEDAYFRKVSDKGGFNDRVFLVEVKDYDK